MINNMASRAIAAALFAAWLPVAPGLAAGPKWEYAMQDGTDGRSRSVYARLAGEGPSYLWLACTRTIFEDERASQFTLTAAVAQRQFLGQSDTRGRTTVYWFDDQPPEASAWIYSDKYGKLIGEQAVRDFALRLTTAQKLKVELSNYRYESVKLDFQLDPNETKVIVDQFKRDCANLRSERI